MSTMSLATAIWGDYLDRHMPDDAPRDIEEIGAEAVSAILFEQGKTLHVVNAKGPRKETAIEEVDEALRKCAEAGSFASFGRLSEAGRNELGLRTSWAIAAARLEAKEDTGFSIPVPAFADEKMKKMAAILFVLAGPGRDIDPRYGA